MPSMGGRSHRGGVTLRALDNQMDWKRLWLWLLEAPEQSESGKGGTVEPEKEKPADNSGGH